MHRRTVHRPGVGIASQTMNEKDVPGAWNVGSFFLYGWEEPGDCRLAPTGGWRAAAWHRRAGIASGGFGLTAERKRVATGGAAGGGEPSESVAVKESL